jgi:DNA-binding transcriptional ArsR family regulator
MDKATLTEEINRLHADLCAALADPRRILILYILSEYQVNVSELASQVGISQPTASRHLKILRERGLVQAVRQGASVEYRLTDLRLIQALDLLRALLRDRLVYQATLADSQTFLEPTAAVED